MEKKNNKIILWAILAVVILAVAGAAIWFFLIRKKKGGKDEMVAKLIKNFKANNDIGSDSQLKRAASCFVDKAISILGMDRAKKHILHGDGTIFNNQVQQLATEQALNKCMSDAGVKEPGPSKRELVQFLAAKLPGLGYMGTAAQLTRAVSCFVDKVVKLIGLDKAAVVIINDDVSILSGQEKTAIEGFFKDCAEKAGVGAPLSPSEPPHKRADLIKYIINKMKKSEYPSDFKINEFAICLVSALEGLIGLDDAKKLIENDDTSVLGDKEGAVDKAYQVCFNNASS